MAPAKKRPTPSGAFQPTDEHKITLGDAHQLLSTISAYGKIIAEATIPPASAGVVHPHGETGDLQLALVYGIAEQGLCITLSKPKKVYLPAPDGPADGCGWDPAKFVVWKNLPRDWQTVQVQTAKKPLAMALSTRESFAAPGIQPFLSDVLCLDWVGLPATIAVDDSQTIQTFWEHNHKTSFSFNEQVSLAQVIQQQYGKVFSPGTLAAGTKVSDLENWIPATL
jgi:hypothetical protein